MPSFRHSGKPGDIVWSLPFIRSLGGGDLYLEIGVDDGGEVRLDRAGYDSLRPFLELQPYIGAVRPFQGETVDYDLDRFRELAGMAASNLVDSYYLAFGRAVEAGNHIEPWLTLPDAIPLPGPDFPAGPRLLVSRTGRYLGSGPVHNPFYDNLVTQGLGPQGLFLGLPDEHSRFQVEYRVSLIHARTASVLEIAAYIKHCSLWAGNQGLIATLVEGFKKPAVLEVNKSYPISLHCVFRRADLLFV